MAKLQHTTDEEQESEQEETEMLNPLDIVYEIVAELDIQSPGLWIAMSQVLGSAERRALPRNLVFEAISQWELMRVMAYDPELERIRLTGKNMLHEGDLSESNDADSGEEKDRNTCGQKEANVPPAKTAPPEWTPEDKLKLAEVITHNVLNAVLILSMQRDPWLDMWIGVEHVFSTLQEIDLEISMDLPASFSHEGTTQPHTVQMAIQQWVQCGILALNREQTAVKCLHMLTLKKATSMEEFHRIRAALHAAWPPKVTPR